MSSPSLSTDARLALAREMLSKADCNLSPEHKDVVARAGATFNRDGQFADAVITRARIVECNARERPEDGRMHARVVFAVSVAPDMCNAHDMMHGGCAAYLVDQCTSVALIVQSLVTGGALVFVSQSLSTTYHAGAKLGDTLHVVCTAVSSGKRVVSARAEIWNRTTERLVVTGTHVKMIPSRSELKL